MSNNATRPPVRRSRINLALIPKAEEALGRVQSATGHNQTDSLNRSIQLLDLVLTNTQAGNKFAFVKPDGKVEVIHIL